MPASSSVALLVISTDDFRDLWRPFFELFWKHWPDCPYPVYLGSEVQTYDDARVRPLVVGRHPDWPTFCIRLLERIEAPITLAMLADFFLYDRVDTAAVEDFAAYLHKHDGACLRLFPCPGPDEPCADHPKVGVIRPGSPFRLSMMASLWNTNTLRGLLRPGEDGWQTEFAGSVRTAQVAQPFFSVQREHRPMRYYCTGLRKGVWMRDAVSLCRAQGVALDLGARQRESLREYLRRMIKFRLEGCRIPACREQHPSVCVRYPCVPASPPAA